MHTFRDVISALYTLSRRNVAAIEGALYTLTSYGAKVVKAAASESVGAAGAEDETKE